MQRTDYRVVVKELADALKMNSAWFVEVDPKVLGLQSFATVKDEAERKELENLFSVDKPSKVRSLCSNVLIVDNARYRSLNSSPLSERLSNILRSDREMAKARACGCKDRVCNRWCNHCCRWLT
jgi:hypothetical protein